MDVNPLAQSATAKAPGTLPYLSAAQASALMRSGLAIAIELIGNAFDAICRDVLEELNAKWDFNVGAPLVQRLLSTKAADLRHAFLSHLKERQDAALADVMTQHAPAPAVGQVSAEMLTLVDAVTTAHGVIVDRAAGKMRGIIEEQLRDLQLIVQHLTGRSALRTAENPFGPEVFMRALLDAAEDLALHTEAWDFYLNAFEKPLAAEIGRIHTALIEHFQRHGLDAKVIRRELAARQAAARGVGAAGSAHAGADPTTQPGAAPPTTPGYGPQGIPGGLSGTMPGAAPGTVGGMPRAMAAAIFDPSVALNNLLARLQSNARDLRLPPMPQVGPAEAPLLEAIGELQQLGLEGVHGAAFAGTAAGSINTWREHLVEKSSRTVDKLTIEIVGMLFDHVLQDKQVPAEIKALISRLQFPVLKAALLDADFFASSTHPARRLIDRIASTAVGWEPYGDENERYKNEVDRIVREVLQKFDKDVAVFEKLLGEFENFVGDISPRDSDPVARAKRALEEAEKREILAINTTIQVRRAFEKVELEPYLRDFLVGPWVQVLVTATLREEQTPGFAKRFREAIHDMVWSVQPKASADDRRRLVELIPNLTRVMRDGLALIHMAEREQNDFFKQLMESHAMAVKPVDQARYIKSSLATTELRARLDGMQLTGTFPITTVAGGVRVSTGALMRAAAEHDAELKVPEPVTDIGPLDRVEEARLDEEISSWQRGTWFSMWNGKEMVKARLRWISPLRTLFLFSSDREKNAHVMPPDLIKNYLKRGKLKALEATPLTKRAVDGVVGDFERMPRRREEIAARYAPAG
ncbi:MAG: DUF1631 family protein [Pseudomonadota bacterium]